MSAVAGLRRHCLAAARTAGALALCVAMAPAEAAVTDLPAFGWDWEAGHVYFLEASVAGVPIALSKDQNRDVVVQGFTIQLALKCGSPERESKRQYEVRCDVQDFALQAKPRPSDAGRTQDVLEEMDDKISGAWLQMRFHDNGSLVNFQLEGLKTHNRKENRMAENMRLILHRAVAGLDLRLPTRPIDREFGVWGQYESVITMYPSGTGTAGAAEMVHLVKQRVGDSIAIETAGRAAISPSGGNDTFDTRIESRTVFNIDDGYMVERIWVAEGWATAGSASAEAGQRPYAQAGRLFVIRDNEEMPVFMNTEELGPSPTKLSDPEATGGVLPNEM
ncbi:MAG: hypothetical protein KC912_02140 [Proteobacteria bacterium]|nr:hypothetical protein [Pseudomonadota bacterium]